MVDRNKTEPASEKEPKTTNKRGGERPKLQAKRSRKAKEVKTGRKETVQTPTPVSESGVEHPASVSPKKIYPTVKPPQIEETEYSEEEQKKLLALYSNTFQELEEGEIIKGKILGVTEKDVIVDVGFKSEGIIPLSEFPHPSEVKVGDEIEVLLEAMEDQEGQLVLSKQKADFMRVWDKIREAHEQGAVVEGKLVRRVKGGMVADVLGVEAFLPGSQISLKQIPNFDELVGQTIALKIIKINKLRRNIVVSRRIILEEEREHQKSRLLSELQSGQIKEGTVKNIIDFGVFVDLGGIDGLLHITDMSWGRINHPSEIVSLGEKIKVKILEFDKATGRVSLGLKQLTPYPWENVEQKYPVGKVMRGKVISLTDYGAFVELEKGVEGLIHISEMSWSQNVKHPSKVLTLGQEIEAMVLAVDKANEKISLGLKQLEPDPWQTLDKRYPLGAKIKGKVRNLTNFGVFVEIEEGVDGLVHISDLSWTKRIYHPSEVVKRGDTIDVVILGIDKGNRRVALGYKQIKEDPWPDLALKYKAGAEVQGKITKLFDRGIIVELEPDVEGLVPLHNLAVPNLTKPQESFQVGETLPLKVAEFDTRERRIVLSAEAYFRDRDKQELEQYQTQHAPRPKLQTETQTTSPSDTSEKPPEISKPDTPAPSSSETKNEGETTSS